MAARAGISLVRRRALAQRARAVSAALRSRGRSGDTAEMVVRDVKSVAVDNAGRAGSLPRGAGDAGWG